MSGRIVGSLATDDDECTYRSDGTDATYCGETRNAHGLP